MTGGVGKNIWGGTDQFYPHLREGRPKKRSLSWPFTFFRSTKLARGGARSLPGGARRNLTVRISLLAHKFRGEEKEKKRLQREILGLVFAYTHVFHPGRKLYLRLWGGRGPKNALQWHLLCYFLSGHNPRLGGTLLAWGAHFSLGGHKQ